MKSIIKKKDLIVFALVWALLFFLLSVYPWFKGGQIRIWAGISAICFILISIVRPSVLSRFYRLWVKIGEFIGGITSKIVLLVLFFFLFTPIALTLKLLGKDLLRKKINRKKTRGETYWIIRNTPPQSMKNQF